MADPLEPISARDAVSVQTSWLISFLAVADQGGFGAATMPLHLSQSRVSAHVAALENALGVILFDRKARPTRTTPAGEAFRVHALAAMHELRRGAEAARSARDDPIACARIGSYPSVSATYLPAVLRELQARQPGVTVELFEGNAATLEEMVAKGAVDIAFRPQLPRMHDSTVRHRTIWREDVVAVMPDFDRLAAGRRVDPGDLRERPLIGNPSGAESDGGGFDLRNSLGEAAGSAVIAYLTDQPATLVALVRSGFGVGVINRLALATTDTRGLAIRAIASPAAHRDVAVFWQHRRSETGVVRALLEAQAAAALPAEVRAS